MIHLPRVEHHFGVDSCVSELSAAAAAPLRDLDAIFVKTVLGRRLDEWQSYAAAVAAQVDDSGLRPQNVVVVTGRQNGKTELGLVRAMRAALVDNQKVLFAANGVAMARSALARIEQLLLLSGRDSTVARVCRSVPNLSIQFVNGSRIWFRTFNGVGGGGRAVTADLVVVDDAQESPEEAALTYLTYSVVCGWVGQIWWLASAPQQRSCGARILAGLRHRALVARDPSVAWLEWSAHEPTSVVGGVPVLPYDDIRDAIREANPATTAGRLDVESLSRRRELLDRETWLADVLSIGTWPSVAAEVTARG